MIETVGRRHTWKGVEGTTIVQLVVHFHSDGHFEPGDEKGPDEWCDERHIDKVTTTDGTEIPAEEWKPLEDRLMYDVVGEPLPNAAS